MKEKVCNFEEAFEGTKLVPIKEKLYQRKKWPDCFKAAEIFLQMKQL